MAFSLYKNLVYKSDGTFTGAAGSNLQTSLGNLADNAGTVLRRTLPGLAAIPSVMASPPTTVVAAGNLPITSGSAIASAVSVNARSNRLTYHGSPLVQFLSGGSWPAYTSGGYSTNTSVSPWVIEFELYTVGGVFEVAFRDSNPNLLRLVVDGQYATFPLPTFANTGNTGGTLLGRCSGLSAGWHRIRLEIGAFSYFLGLNIGPTDTVRPVPPPAQRMVVVGDSFTEPTVSDNTSGVFSGWGFPQYLGQMLGMESWSCGKGATGYLNPGSFVPFGSRLADVTLGSPDVVLWCGGVNDYAYATYSYANLYAAVLNCLQSVAASLPKCRQVVCSPFYSVGHYAFPVAMLEARDAIAAAAAAAGVSYIDVLTPAVPSGVLQAAGTVTTQNAANASTLASSATFAIGTIVQIDTGAKTEIRTVSNVSGTGPYTLTVAEGGQNLNVVHAVGATISQVGDAMITGAGRQGTTSGVGNADLFRGPDATHPTMLGHVNLAQAVYDQMARA